MQQTNLIYNLSTVKGDPCTFDFTTIIPRSLFLLISPPHFGEYDSEDLLASVTFKPTRLYANCLLHHLDQTLNQ